MEERDETLEGSKCRDCDHLISRIILPMDYEEFGIDITQLRQEIEEQEKIPLDNEEIAIVHNTCVVLNMDLGYLVIECNKYSKKGTPTIFNANPWKNKT